MENTLPATQLNMTEVISAIAFNPRSYFWAAQRRHGLHFDTVRQTGAVFYMMSALGDSGSLGSTTAGDSPENAERIYQRTVEVLNEEAKAAIT